MLDASPGKKQTKDLPAARNQLHNSNVAIKEVIQAINQMQADGVVERYAIGGAVGATFYLEPSATMDVDIFADFKSEPGSFIVNPQPVFDYLKQRGCSMEGEYVIIGGWPVQFLPPVTPLVEEALQHPVTKDVGGTPARVLSAEYLAAIALQTGRAKDKARLLQFVEAGVLDAERFEAILGRHNLLDLWHRFERQFLHDIP
jgi:hypothetical protein